MFWYDLSRRYCSWEDPPPKYHHLKLLSPISWLFITPGGGLELNNFQSTLIEEAFTCVMPFWSSDSCERLRYFFFNYFHFKNGVILYLNNFKCPFNQGCFGKFGWNCPIGSGEKVKKKMFDVYRWTDGRRTDNRWPGKLT